MSLKYRNVDEAWRDYATHVLPKNCGTNQRIETKRAFYAGAQAMFAIAVGHVASLDDEAAEKAMSDLNKELMQFAHEVMMRRA